MIDVESERKRERAQATRTVSIVTDGGVGGISADGGVSEHIH